MLLARVLALAEERVVHRLPRVREDVVLQVRAIGLKVLLAAPREGGVASCSLRNATCELLCYTREMREGKRERELKLLVEEV